MAETGMSENEFRDYLDGLTTISPFEIGMALYSSLSPITVHKRLFQMKLKALSFEISGDMP